MQIERAKPLVTSAETSIRLEITRQQRSIVTAIEE